MTVSSGLGVARRMQAHSANRVTAASGVSDSASVTGAESSTSAASSRSNIAGSGHTWASRAARPSRPPLPGVGHHFPGVFAIEPHPATLISAGGYAGVSVGTPSSTEEAL
jgi:hypothetical protein